MSAVRVCTCGCNFTEHLVNTSDGAVSLSRFGCTGCHECEGYVQVVNWEGALGVLEDLL